MNNEKYIIYDYDQQVVLTHYSSNFEELEWKGWIEEYDNEVKTNSSVAPFTFECEDNAKQLIRQITYYYTNVKKKKPEEVDIRYLEVYEKTIYVLSDSSWKIVVGNQF